MDRFISAEWMDIAAEAVRGEVSMAELEARLQLDISAASVRVKTRGILSRMWLSSSAAQIGVAMEAASIIRREGDAAKPAAYCSVAIAAYPYFAEVRETVGRLLRTHETCTAGEIHRRMFERHGKRSTIDQATSYTFKTMLSWGLLTRSADGRFLLPTDLTLSRDGFALINQAASIYRQSPQELASGEPLLTGFRRSWV
ncbi:hypothetical protein [Sphingomonas sp. PvP056]|uniref:hypothetical protein n=1 Tax=Sphingomonas sp. PvP056 TaxID=3156392 RepID=UPI00339107D8